jgi:hypothetical protein
MPSLHGYAHEAAGFGSSKKPAAPLEKQAYEIAVRRKVLEQKFKNYSQTLESKEKS